MIGQICRSVAGTAPEGFIPLRAEHPLHWPRLVRNDMDLFAVAQRGGDFENTLLSKVR
jgi:hypothetical protein